MPYPQSKIILLTLTESVTISTPHTHLRNITLEHGVGILGNKRARVLWVLCGAYSKYNTGS